MAVAAAGSYQGTDRSAYGIAAPQVRGGLEQVGLVQPVRVKGGRPAGAGGFAVGADLRGQRPAGPFVALGGGPGLCFLLVEVHLGGGHRAGGDLHGSLQSVAHGVLERVGVCLGAHRYCFLAFWGPGGRLGPGVAWRAELAGW